MGHPVKGFVDIPVEVKLQSIYNSCLGLSLLSDDFMQIYADSVIMPRKNNEITKPGEMIL